MQMAIRKMEVLDFTQSLIYEPMKHNLGYLNFCTHIRIYVHRKQKSVDGKALTVKKHLVSFTKEKPQDIVS